MAECLFTCSFGKLVPEDETAKAFMASTKHGALVRVKVSKPRNQAHHRLFFALLRLVADQTGLTTTRVLFMLKIKTGHVERIKFKDGTVAFDPKSINFAKMDQVAFREFFDRCVSVIVDEWLPGVKSADVQREVESMVGARMAA